MTDRADVDRSLHERVANIPRNLRALDVAVRHALLQHKRAGHPVAVWRDGQVVWIPPEDIPADVDDEPGSGSR
jgi:hypothetical protein